jgi:hypothetical protein
VIIGLFVVVTAGCSTGDGRRLEPPVFPPPAPVAETLPPVES